MKALLLITASLLSLASRVVGADPPPFSADVTHGNIRVVLMSVGQTTVFPNEKDRAEIANARRPEGGPGVPCFHATFLVESLGDKPLGTFTVKDFEVSCGGKPLERPSKGVDYQQAFEYRSLQDFLDFKKPKVADEKRAKIIRFARFGAVPSLDLLNLQLKAGFDQDVDEFRFESVRLK